MLGTGRLVGATGRTIDKVGLGGIGGALRFAGVLGGGVVGAIALGTVGLVRGLGGLGGIGGGVERLTLCCTGTGFSSNR